MKYIKLWYKSNKILIFRQLKLDHIQFKSLYFSTNAHMHMMAPASESGTSRCCDPGVLIRGIGGQKLTHSRTGVWIVVRVDQSNGRDDSRKERLRWVINSIFNSGLPVLDGPHD